MNIINYNQCDSKWKYLPYAAGGDKRTICSDGCGPACIADIVATYIDPEVTPVEVCNLSMQKGFKAPYQGTYYAGISKLLESYGIKARQLNFSNIYSIPSSPYHQQAMSEIKKGNLVIACMGKGRWTSSGHYVLWYDYNANNDRVLINDPYTQKDSTQNAPYVAFKNEVKYYFIVEMPKRNTIKTIDEALKLFKKVGIANDSAYWTSAAQVVPYLDVVIINSANDIANKTVFKSTKEITYEKAIDVLLEKNIITELQTWLNARKYIYNFEILVKNIALKLL